MGHEVGVTPLQMIMAMATIANGGELVAPRIVKSIVDENGKVISELKPTVVRRVISKEAAAAGHPRAPRCGERTRHRGRSRRSWFHRLRQRPARRRKSIRKAATSTARKSFPSPAFCPRKIPAFVGLVILDDPQAPPEENYGGKVAGPIFARVAEKAARYLDLEPHEEPDKAARRGTSRPNQCPSLNRRAARVHTSCSSKI